MRALVISLVLLLPLAGAQHAHMGGGNGMAMVLHDGPDSGRAVVGSVTHLGFALLDAQGVPSVHQNAEFLVTLDNVTVFATKDTHEYDGLFSLDLVFARPGHYAVTAMSGEMTTGVFEGEVVTPVNETVAKALIVTKTAPPSNLVDVVIDIQGPDGKTIPHTDAILEWRTSAGMLAARYHMHIHEKPIAFTQGFDAPGDYRLTVTSYKAFATGSATSPDVQAVVGSATVTVGAVGAPAGPPDVSAFPPPRLEPAGPKVSSDGLTLYGMFDPQNQVGLGFPLRLSALIEGADAAPKPHVDFALSVTGPHGLVYKTQSLHEYDGHLEWLFVPQLPGAYDALVVADAGTSKLSLPMHFQVLPPVAPVSAATGAGAALGQVSVKGLDKVVAGEPANLTFLVMGPNGPIQHSEVDVTISKKGEPAAYSFKLHTHESGVTNALVAFPSEGEWTLGVDAAPTDPQAIVFVGPDGPGAPVAFHAKAVGGVIVAASLAPVSDSVKPVPALGFAWFSIALVGAACLVARRSG